MFTTVLLIAALSGCSQEDPNHTGTIVNGTLSVCLGGPEGTVTEDAELLISGTIKSIDTGVSDAMNLVTCGTDPTHSIEIEDANGATWTVGLSVDFAGEDKTPVFDVAEGDIIDLDFRERLVWGTVAGFTLSDDLGLIAAVDEGTWGGALDPGQTGIEVTPGDTVLQTEVTECQPIETFDLTFQAESDVTLRPGYGAHLTVAGNDLWALAVAAWDYGSSPDCSISDATGASSWLVYR